MYEFSCLFVYLLRYDYFVFNDVKGVQMKFDQKVGIFKWLKQVNFSGFYFYFLFYFDSSNIEWGYKFKVSKFIVKVYVSVKNNFMYYMQFICFFVILFYMYQVIMF